MTTETAARAFIETIAEHFKGGRKPSTRALADLERELIADGYSADVLERAARDMLRTRYARSFPSVAECLAACQVAKGQLRARNTHVAADGTALASGDGRDSDPVTAPESWPRQHETGSRPGLGDGESVAMAPMKSARAA